MSDDSVWRPPTSGDPNPPPPPRPTPPPPPPPAGGGREPAPPGGYEPVLPPAGGEPAAMAPPPMAPPAGPPAAGDVVVVPATPERSRKKKGLLVGAVIGVLAIGGAGVFAATQMGGDDGGAASPEELGEEVMAAFENEDALGMVDLLLPGERDLLRDPLVEFVSELSRLEVLGPDADLSAVEGVDIVLENESVEVDRTNVDDIANLRLSADATVVVDGEELPLGDLIFDYVEDLDVDALDTEQSEDFEFAPTSVEVDGRWYLSIGFSAAEAARRSMSEPPDIPATGVEPAGGETPEGALDAIFDGIEALDVERLIAALNPGEAAALQRYAPLFLDDVEVASDELPFTIEITESEYSIEGGGDTRHASIELLVIEVAAEGDVVTLEYADGCFTLDSAGEQVNSCDLAQGGEDLGELVPDPEAFEELAGLIEDVFDDYEQPGITLRETDGMWYVSPVGTIFDQSLAVINALDRGEIDRLVDEGTAAFEAAMESVFGAPFQDLEDLDDLGVDDFEDLEIIDDVPASTVPSDDDTPVGTLPLDTVPDDETAAWAGDECWAADSAADAVACFQTLIAAGTVEPFEVPVELRFPECGVAEPYFNGYYTLTDAEFFAVVDAARQCFLDLASTGEVEESELPPEYTSPECFEGRNWYAVFDDPDYDERFYACI